MQVVSKEEAERRWHFGAVFYHEDTRAAGREYDEDSGIVGGKPTFSGEERAERGDIMKAAGDEKRTKELQRMAKRGEKVVDKNGMRWDL